VLATDGTPFSSALPVATAIATATATAAPVPTASDDAALLRPSLALKTSLPLADRVAAVVTLLSTLRTWARQEGAGRRRVEEKVRASQRETAEAREALRKLQQQQQQQQQQTEPESATMASGLHSHLFSDYLASSPVHGQRTNNNQQNHLAQHSHSRQRLEEAQYELGRLRQQVQALEETNALDQTARAKLSAELSHKSAEARRLHDDLDQVPLKIPVSPDLSVPQSTPPQSLSPSHFFPFSFFPLLFSFCLSPEKEICVSASIAKSDHPN
jgi:hypothetical protein